MTLSEAIDALTTIATDAACWRILHEDPENVPARRAATGAELYAALDVLLALPLDQLEPATALLLDPSQPR